MLSNEKYIYAINVLTNFDFIELPKKIVSIFNIMSIPKPVRMDIYTDKKIACILDQDIILYRI